VRSSPLIRVAISAIVAWSTTPTPAAAQGALGASLQEIRRASTAGEHERALHVADSLVRELPNHPSVLFVRAVALARSGRAEDAVAAVRRLERLDARYARSVLADSTLAPLRLRLDSAGVHERAARADRPIARARHWATIRERDFVPEGTAFDPATNTVFVGSLFKGRIVAVAADGTVREFAGTSSGLRSVVGIHVDTTRRLLWAVSNSRYDIPSDSTPSELFAFDLSSGAVRSRHRVAEGGAHFLNDITTGADGTVYVTDSQAGAVWTLRGGAGSLARFTAAGDWYGPNGITISSDGARLFVADATGIRVVPLAGGASWRLATPDSIAVTGVDGLAFTGNSLIAHHPLAFWRIARYPLDAGHRAIVGRELIESGTPDARTSTTGEVANGEYVFIGNSQIDRMNARTVDSTTMQPIRLYRVPLASAPRGIVAVALSGRDSVALFDAQSLERLTTVRVGADPHEIAASPDGRRGYVADAGASSITVLDVSGEPRVAATWQLPDSIRVHDVAASADGRTVWAVSGAQRLALELDASSGRTGRRLELNRTGGWMVHAGAPDSEIVIAHLEGGAVTLLHPSSGAQRTLEAREGEIDAASTADRREIWSVNMRDGHLTVFDATSGRQIERQQAGPGAGRVELTPDGRLAIVVTGGDSTIAAYDVATRRRVASVVVPAGPKVIALSPDGRRAYVTHPERGALTMVDVPSMTVLRSIDVPGTPDGVEVLREAAPPPALRPR
jgi:DNA-binding beta-propeller fold protein YncE